MAQDGILPEQYAQLNDKQVPANAILLAVLLSLPIPFLGRTAIGWIVDTTTIGAVILYGFVSVAVFKVSGQEGCKRNRIISGICLFILVAFLLFLLFDTVSQAWLPWFNEELYKFKMAYRGTEKVKTDFGKFECLKFSPVLENDATFKNEDDMVAWFTNDGNYVPVRIIIKLPLGKAKCELRSYKNLKNKDGFLK